MKSNYRIRKRHIEQIAEDEIRSKLIESIWDDVDDLNSSTFKHVWKILSAGQQALFAVSLLESEVDNGGIHQFFYNSTGLLAHEVLNGFKLLEAEKYVELLEKTYSLFPDGRVPKQRGERQKQLKHIAQEVTRKLFDVPFFELCRNNQTGIDFYALKYLAAHADAFLISDYEADALEARERKQRDEQLQKMLTRDYRIPRSKYPSDILSNAMFDSQFRDDLEVSIKAGDASISALFSALTPGQKALMLARWIFAFGGLKNYFVTKGHFFSETVESLKLVGADEYAKVLESVWDNFLKSRFILNEKRGLQRLNHRMLRPHVNR